jgi:hypothetical protein
MPGVNRAVKCRGAGLGWLYIEPRQASGLYSGAPQLEHPDPHQSGQNPEFCSFVWERVKQYTARDNYYRQQVEQRLAELDKALARSAASVNAAVDDVARAQAERDRVAALLPADPESSNTTAEAA